MGGSSDLSPVDTLANSGMPFPSLPLDHRRNCYPRLNLTELENSASKLLYLKTCRGYLLVGQEEDAEIGVAILRRVLQARRKDILNVGTLEQLMVEKQADLKTVMFFLFMNQDNALVDFMERQLNINGAQGN